MLPALVNVRYQAAGTPPRQRLDQAETFSLPVLSIIGFFTNLNKVFFIDYPIFTVVAASASFMRVIQKNPALATLWERGYNVAGALGRRDV